MDSTLCTRNHIQGSMAGPQTGKHNPVNPETMRDMTENPYNTDPWGDLMTLFISNLNASHFNIKL